MASTMNKISGKIHFEEPITKASQATIRIRLDEVSRADAPSTTVAETDLTGFELEPGHKPINFELTAELIPSYRYTLFVHIDFANDGQISPGDYLTQEYFGVTIPLSKQPYQVRVKMV